MLGNNPLEERTGTLVPSGFEKVGVRIKSEFNLQRLIVVIYLFHSFRFSLFFFLSKSNEPSELDFCFCKVRI